MLPNTMVTMLTAVPRSCRDAFVPAVIEGALAIPALEDRLGGQAELLVRVLREVEALVLLDNGLVLLGQLVQVLGREVSTSSSAARALP
jgi:hypothetical protein